MEGSSTRSGRGKPGRKTRSSAARAGPSSRRLPANTTRRCARGFPRRSAVIPRWWPTACPRHGPETRTPHEVCGTDHGGGKSREAELRQVEPGRDAGRTQQAHVVRHGTVVAVAERGEEPAGRGGHGEHDRSRQAIHQGLEHREADRAVAVLLEHHEPLHPVGRYVVGAVPQPDRQGAHVSHDLRVGQDQGGRNRHSRLGEVPPGAGLQRGKHLLRRRLVAPGRSEELGQRLGVRLVGWHHADRGSGPYVARIPMEMRHDGEIRSGSERRARAAAERRRAEEPTAPGAPAPRARASPFAVPGRRLG